MSRKPIKDSCEGFVKKQLQNDPIYDFNVESWQGDDLDDNTVSELIKELRRKYPKNNAIIKLSKALDLEPIQEQNGKDFIREDYRLNAGFVKYNKAGLEDAAGLADSGDRKAVVDIEKHSSSDFYRALNRIIVDLQNNTG